MPTTARQPRLEQLDAFVIESVKEVCSTMLGWRVDSAGPCGDGHPAPFQLREFNGTIGFGGCCTGSIFLSCSESLVLQMARRVLGSDRSPDPHELCDVVGELSSMIAGGCKSRLSDVDCSVLVSNPNVIRGKLIRASSRDVKFVLQRQFTVPIQGESFNVIMLGKFD